MFGLVDGFCIWWGNLLWVFAWFACVFTFTLMLHFNECVGKFVNAYRPTCFRWVGCMILIYFVFLVFILVLFCLFGICVDLLLWFWLGCLLLMFWWYGFVCLMVVVGVLDCRAWWVVWFGILVGFKLFANGRFYVLVGSCVYCLFCYLIIVCVCGLLLLNCGFDCLFVFDFLL